jgi:hypothetical protein
MGALCDNDSAQLVPFGGGQGWSRLVDNELIGCSRVSKRYAGSGLACNRDGH